MQRDGFIARGECIVGTGVIRAVFNHNLDRSVQLNALFDEMSDARWSGIADFVRQRRREDRLWVGGHQLPKGLTALFSDFPDLGIRVAATERPKEGSVDFSGCTRGLRLSQNIQAQSKSSGAQETFVHAILLHQ